MTTRDTSSIGASLVFAALGALCLVCSGILLHLHTVTILDMNDRSVPIVGELPLLERRLSALKQQQELSELHAATRVGSQEEYIFVYSLPEETDTARLLALFEVVSESLAREELLASMSDITFGEIAERGDLYEQPLAVQFAVHKEGIDTILLLVRLAGLLSVGDVLSSEQVEMLIERTEDENPAGIVALEQFLSVSLLEYAKNQRLYEENLRRSFSSTQFVNTLQHVTRTSLLAEAREFLQGDIGSVLDTYKLWPIQFLTIDHVSLQPGAAPDWYNLSLKLKVLSRV